MEHTPVTAAGRPEAERGAALVFVVLVLLAIGLLSHGMLAAALGEVRASRAALRQVQARAAAEAAVRLALAGGGGAWMDSVPVGGARQVVTVALGPATGRAELGRIGSESWLVEGRGGRGGSQVRAARLAWSLDALERVRALAGALSVPPAAPVTVAGVVDVSAPAGATPPLAASDCAPWQAGLAAHYATTALAPVAIVADTIRPTSIGLLDLPIMLAGAADTVLAGGTPGPVEVVGYCDRDAPWNWGDPERPWRPCGAYLPLVGAPGDLRVEGGVGQGMLVVDGALTLAGARYHGLVVTRGPLVLETGAELHGLALAGGGVYVGAGARVMASGCWAARALAAQRAVLGGLVLVPGVGPLGPP